LAVVCSMVDTTEVDNYSAHRRTAVYCAPP
jgi:hypothetical protein